MRDSAVVEDLPPPPGALECEGRGGGVAIFEEETRARIEDRVRSREETGPTTQIPYGVLHLWSIVPVKYKMNERACSTRR